MLRQSVSRLGSATGSFFASSQQTRSLHGGVGFIGLGNMGASMARNLVQNAEVGKKVPVTVFDLNKESVAKLVEVGAKAADSVAELARTSSVIVTMLPATAHVRGTLLGDQGVFKNAPKGALIIDSSTIDPLASRDFYTAAKEHGHEFLDAPVSGGVTGAFAGTLTFMVGGDDATLNRAKPVLNAMGRNIVHCGPSGAGGITKLCNNLSLAISMVGTCEAMALVSSPSANSLNRSRCSQVDAFITLL